VEERGGGGRRNGGGCEGREVWLFGGSWGWGIRCKYGYKGLGTVGGRLGVGSGVKGRGGGMSE